MGPKTFYSIPDYLCFAWNAGWALCRDGVGDKLEYTKACLFGVSPMKVLPSDDGVQLIFSCIYNRDPLFFVSLAVKSHRIYSVFVAVPLCHGRQMKCISMLSRHNITSFVLQSLPVMKQLHFIFLKLIMPTCNSVWQYLLLLLLKTVYTTVASTIIEFVSVFQWMSMKQLAMNFALCDDFNCGLLAASFAWVG